jgi:hypothetical protein
VLLLEHPDLYVWRLRACSLLSCVPTTVTSPRYDMCKRDDITDEVIELAVRRVCDGCDVAETGQGLAAALACLATVPLRNGCAANLGAVSLTLPAIGTTADARPTHATDAIEKGNDSCPKSSFWSSQALPRISI